MKIKPQKTLKIVIKSQMPVKRVPLIDKSQIHNDVDVGIQSVCTKIVTLRIKIKN